MNECHQENACAGAGQWCVNTAGGHVCCSAESELPECRGLELVPDPRPRAFAQAEAEADDQQAEEGNQAEADNQAEANAFAQVKGGRTAEAAEEGGEESLELAGERSKRRRFRTSEC